MNKILKSVLCFALIAVSCFAFSGCNKNNSSNQPITYTNITIDSQNFSDYFSLNGYLAYQYNYGNGNLNNPWADYFYEEGFGYKYLTGNNEHFYKKSSEWDLSNFTTNNNLNEDGSSHLRWKTVLLEAEKEIILTDNSFTAYGFESYYPSINIKYEILDKNKNNALIDTVSTWNLSLHQQPYIYDRGQLGYEKNKTIPLTRWWNSDEDYDWENKNFILKKGQILSIVFETIDRIEPHFSSLDESLSSTDEDQINRYFYFGNLSFKGKIENNK